MSPRPSEEFCGAANGESGRQDRLDQGVLWIPAACQSADVSDAFLRLPQRSGSTLLVDVVGRVAVHVALANEYALPLF